MVRGSDLDTGSPRVALGILRVALTIARHPLSCLMFVVCVFVVAVVLIVLTCGGVSAVTDSSHFDLVRLSTRRCFEVQSWVNLPLATSSPVRLALRGLLSIARHPCHR